MRGVPPYTGWSVLEPGGRGNIVQRVFDQEAAGHVINRLSV